MASMIDDLYSANVLDEPDDLERVIEGGGIEHHQSYDSGGDEDDENKDQPEDGDGGEDGKADDKKDEKKKRKLNRRPTLNILRLMDTKNGLVAAEKMFQDVKFKGKGYEREDLNLIMKKMEIWAHKLYPSFQFDDFLGKLEKLGNSKGVATYIKKIRLGMEEDVVVQPDDEIVEPASPRPSSPDPFDQLVSNTSQHQSAVQSQSLPSQGGLTKEQKERMLKNRLIAEQRRMARLKAQQEKVDTAGAPSVSENRADGHDSTLHHIVNGESSQEPDKSFASGEPAEVNSSSFNSTAHSELYKSQADGELLAGGKQHETIGRNDFPSVHETSIDGACSSSTVELRPENSQQNSIKGDFLEANNAEEDDNMEMEDLVVMPDSPPSQSTVNGNEESQQKDTKI